MTKFLAYERTSQQVVTVDTVNATVTDLGTTIATADTTNAFPNRSENIVTVFRGVPYLLYLDTTNEIRLSAFSLGGGTWTDVPGFTPITTGSGFLTPVALHVVKNRLVAIASRSSSSGVDGIFARRSDADDAATWSALISTGFITQPTTSTAGATIVWHNAVFFTTAEGIGYYDPAADFIVASFDSGSNSLVVGQKANFGSFSILDGDLYYVLPTDNPVGAPTLYSLDKVWSVAAPTPTFQLIVLSIPGVGDVTLNNDAGNYSLFVNKVGIMTLFYSGTISSKAVTIAKSGASFVVTDITTATFPTTLSGEPSLGFSLFVDDRRRANEQHSVVVRFRPSIPISVLIYSWDGVGSLTQVATLNDGGAGLDLMIPDDERSDFRTYTGNEPSAYIDATSEPFPGQTRVDYTIQDEFSRPMDITPEYSLDGQTWLAMSQGDGDSGVTSLASTPSGTAYFFHWDAFVDLVGDYDNVDIRVVARISGV